MAEARVAAELILGNASDEFDEPTVNVLLLPEHLGERQVLLLLGRPGIEGVDAPYVVEYRGSLLPARTSGRFFSASSSQVVTCAMMSLTDHAPVTPGSSNSGSRKPAYDSLNALQALSRRVNSRWRLSMERPFAVFHRA